LEKKGVTFVKAVLIIGETPHDVIETPLTLSEWEIIKY
jgi:hypothetical protein